MGDYEILEEIARGGMGVVYRARQMSLNREVAIKTVHSVALNSSSARLRLQTEAEAIAQLDHPNIVSLYESGEYDGQFFFSMRLVRGGNFFDYLRRTDITLRQRIRALSQAAKALDHAHARGILHRDIKPSNILIDSEGKPQLTDFGLAKFTQSPGDLTHSDAAIGTPSYMSPEQASGARSVTTASDIYGLGAVLYEILTGRPPYIGDTPLETLRHVTEGNLERPKISNPAVDPNLEVVCLKCLESEPERRYANAQEVAAELDRWLSGDPVLARPVSRCERLVRWTRKEPILATSIAAVFVLLIATSVLSTENARRIRAEKIATERRLLTLRSEAAERKFHDGRPAEGLALLAQLSRENPKDKRLQHRLANALLFEKFTLPTQRRIEISDGPILAKASLLDRAECLTLSKNGQILLSSFDAPNTPIALADLGAPIQVGAISSNGQRIAAAFENGEVALLNAVDAQLPTRRLPHADVVTAMSLSANGHYLATLESDRTLSIWDCEAGQRVLGPHENDDEILGMRFSEDGALFASSDYDSGVYIVNVRQGTLQRTIPDFEGFPYLAFSPDKQKLAGGSAGGVVRMWDVETGESIGESPGYLYPTQIHGIEFNREGSRVLTYASDGAARVWDATDGKLTLTLDHGADVLDGEFTDDNNFLVTSGNDGSVIVWDAWNGHRIFAPFSHSSAVRWVDTHRETGRTIGYCADGSIWLWENDSRPETHTPLMSGGLLQDLALDTHAERLAIASRKQGLPSDVVSFWNPSTFQAITGDVVLNTAASKIAFSHKGDLLAIATRDEIRVVTLPDRETIHAAPIRTSAVGTLQFSPNDARLLFATQDAIQLIEPQASRSPRLLKNLQNAPTPHRAAFSPDGRYILMTGAIRRPDSAASIQPTGEFEILDTFQNLTTGPFPLQSPNPIGVYFAPRNRHAVIAGEHFIAILTSINPSRLTEIPNPGEPTAGALDLSGNRFAIGFEDGAVQVWDLTDAIALLCETSHETRVTSLAFSPDGQCLATGSQDQTARLWDVATGLPIAPAIKHGAPTRVLFNSQEQLLTFSIAGDGRLWTPAHLKQTDPTWLPNLAEFVAGGAIEDDGSFRTHSNARRDQCLQELLIDINSENAPNLYNRYLKPFSKFP